MVIWGQCCQQRERSVQRPKRRRISDVLKEQQKGGQSVWSKGNEGSEVVGEVIGEVVRRAQVV